MTKQLAHILALGLALSTVAACGDDGQVGPTPDAPPDAADAEIRAVVVAGDFDQAGVMSELDVRTLRVTPNVAPTGAISSDPVLRLVGDELFVVNRFGGNNVTILDRGTFAVKEQIGTGAGSNPQDVAVHQNKLYIPALGTAGVVVATRGSTTTTTIDLSALDPDGLPDCVSAHVLGGEIYVACGLLEQFAPTGPGKLVVIDPATDTVRTTIDLATRNPFGLFEALPGGTQLVLPSVDFGDGNAGCIERITAGATPTATCLVTNEVAGGYTVSSAVQRLPSGNDILWMVVTSNDFSRADLRGYDITTSTMWPDPVTPPAQLLNDVVVCPNGELVVADKTMASNGLRVLDDGGRERTTAPLAIGLAPASSHGLVCF